MRRRTKTTGSAGIGRLAGFGVKAPSGELTLYAALLLSGSVFVASKLPTTAPEFWIVSAALAACLAVGAVLLVARFRCSPEVFAALFVFVLGWGIVRGVTEGFTGTRIGLVVGAACALFAYPSLRREVRGRAAPDAEPGAAADTGGESGS